MTMEVIADIYLGKVVMWNDKRLATLNPSLAPFLPNETISVVYQNGSSVITTLITAAMSSVPEFNATVLLSYSWSYGDRENKEVIVNQIYKLLLSSYRWALVKMYTFRYKAQAAPYQQRSTTS